MITEMPQDKEMGDKIASQPPEALHSPDTIEDKNISRPGESRPLPDSDREKTEDPQQDAGLFSPSPANDNEPPPAPDGGWYAWAQVGCAFIVTILTYGMLNTFGVFQTYYEQELLASSGSSAISWIGSLQGAFLLMMGPLTGPLFDRGYFQSLVWSGLFLIIFGMFMTSLCTEFYQVFLAQGLCMGIGNGLVFLPSVTIVSQYFTNHRALAMGVQSVGSPLAGIVFPIIFSNLLPSVGFAWATRVLAFIMLGLSLVPFFFMKTRLPPPATKRAFLDNTAFSDVPFLLFSLGGLFAFLGLYVPYFYIQLYAIQYNITSQSFSAYLVTFLNVGSVVGRLVPNFFADKLGASYMMIATTLGAAIMAFAWFGIDTFPSTVVFTILFGFFNGGVTSLPPSVIATLTTDMSRLGTRMGMAFASFGLSTLIGTPIAGAILGDASMDRWYGLMGYAGATLLLGGLIYCASDFFHARQRKAKLARLAESQA